MASKKEKSSEQQAHYSTQAKGTSARRYHSYLLRIWREYPQSPWRIQLEDPISREVFGFQTMEKLMQFLEEKMPEMEESPA
jgi:hypothetical protein